MFHQDLTPYELHQSGRYADAARGYQAVLDRDPDNADVLHLFGVMHHQCGYSTRGAELTGRAIALKPDVAAYHANLAEIRRTLGQHKEAAESCRTALRLRPNFPEALNNLGLALHELGQNEEAIAQYDAALALRPDFALAQNNRGNALRALGKTAEAIEAFRTAISAEPEAQARDTSALACASGSALGRAHASLGQLLADQGQLVEGLAHCREAVRVQPDLAAGHNNLGNVLRALERWSEAEAAYAEAIRLEPDLGVAHANLGLTLQQQGKPGAALPHFRRAAELAPDDAAACQQLAHAHGLAEDWEAAIPPCERRVQLKPQDADAHNDLGWAYQSADRPAEAEAAYRRALELAPDHLDARLNLGSLHEELGTMAEAEACYHEAEKRHADSPLPLARRAVLVRGRLPDSDRDRLRFEMYRPHGPLWRMNLLFALAQVADSRGDYAEAAACLEPANALARDLRKSRGQTYDADEHSRYVDRLIAAFTPELFGAWRVECEAQSAVRSAPCASRSTLHAPRSTLHAPRSTLQSPLVPQPVFVFGMPRSGTTLVEQVLASHSQVFGAGELPFGRRAMDALPPAADRPDDMSAALEALDDSAIEKLARGYQDAVAALLAPRPSPLAPLRIVDKMPDNYLYLGLLALLFPQATFIHVQRDVRDVAVSCWMTHFRSIRWADNQDDLARRIGDYQRLMAHWRRVLEPVGCVAGAANGVRLREGFRGTGDAPYVRIHEVCYERLVDDFETEARRLVAACGLEWEPACLRFHETARPVRTASITQVRQPLYRKSVARWKAYEPFLAPLFDRVQEKPETRNPKSETNPKHENPNGNSTGELV